MQMLSLIRMQIIDRFTCYSIIDSNPNSATLNITRISLCTVLLLLLYKFSDAHFCLDFGKDFEHSVQILAAVACRYLSTYASLALRHDGIAEANNVNALLQATCGKLLSDLCIKQHNGNDGMIALGNGKTKLAKLCSEILGIVVDTQQGWP